MFDYQVSKHPHFDEACRAFALRHNLVQLAERAGMNVQILRNKLNPAQPHLLTAPEIWLLTDLTEDSTLVDGFLAQIHCLPCVPINEVAKEKLPHYVMSATAEIGRVAAGAVLDNPRLDAILAAADAGCFATYIMKQGGVLVPRKYHLIRTAYEINEEPTAYGDHGIRIYGIWSPIAEGKICTHAVKWKMVRKAVDVQEAAADQGACAPWTRGNNCPLAENLNQQEKDKSADGDTRTDITCMDDKELHDYLHSMSKKDRRELAARLRLVKPKRRKDYKQRITDHQRQQLVYELKSRGFDGSEKEVELLLRGGSIPSGAGLRIFYRNQRLQEDDKWRNMY